MRYIDSRFTYLLTVDKRASVTKNEERMLRGGLTVMRLCRYDGRVVVAIMNT